MSLRTRDKGFAEVFGKNLCCCRERLGITQEDLGFLAGLHRTAVGQLERGERVARADTLVRLCGSLGVRPEVLLAGLAWRPAQIARGELEIEEVEVLEASEGKATKDGMEPEGQERNREPARSSESQQ